MGLGKNKNVYILEENLDKVEEIRKKEKGFGTWVNKMVSKYKPKK